MEIIDETNGPGRVLNQQDAERMQLREIWRALGFEDNREPMLDEVLIEIRDLVAVRQSVRNRHIRPNRQLSRDADITPLMPDEDADEDEDEPHEVIENGGLVLPAVQSVTYGAFGMTITGYSAAEVMQIREHGLRTAKEAKS
jgi:hypothetical protein